MAELLLRLASRHRLALLYLRGPDDTPLDAGLVHRCDVVEEVERPTDPFTPFGIWLGRLRRAGGLVRGRPMWATDWNVAAFHQRLQVVSTAWRPDVVQIEYPVMAQYLPHLACSSAPVVLSTHEPGASAARDSPVLHRGRSRLAHTWDAWAWARFERKVVRAVETVVVFTDRDARAVAALGQPTPIVRIPLGTDGLGHPLDPRGANPPSVAFVGNYMHPPNVDAALRLARAIFPRLRTAYPALTLYLVGDHPPAELRQLADDHLVVTGRVPDVRLYLDRAALVIAPLRLGGGMRVKVLEALAGGKALVASPLAIEGLALADGEQVVLAEHDDDFVEASLQLLADPVRRAVLAAQAARWACAHLGWERSVAAYETLYEHLLAGGQPAEARAAR